MNVLVYIDYITTRSSKHPNSYAVWFGETDEEECSLWQSREPIGDVVIYRGVFANEADAVRAALGYIAAPCSLLTVTDNIDGSSAVRVVEPDSNLRSNAKTTVRLLGRRTQDGAVEVA